MRTICLLLGIVALTTAAAQAVAWKPVDGPLKTRWAKDVRPENPLPEYPRPMMVREEWQSLNGVWQFAPANPDEQPPVGRDLGEQILVPFPVESALSGIMRHEERMWYRRTFEVPKAWDGRHVLLHLDAVDWEATVYLNGQPLGTHRGGYDAFGFDITKHLKKDGPQELIVGVFDPTDKGEQPRGKQVIKPGGILYTPTSGIWQTVWIEPVNAPFIEGVKIDPDVDGGEVRFNANVAMAKSQDRVEITVHAMDGGDKALGQPVSGHPNNPIKQKLLDAQLWTPEHPFLYAAHVTLRRGEKVLDEVDTYFAMRKVALGKDEQGITRIMLNGKPVFMTGPLDQGFWPDGIYTAPTDEALRWDIETTKKLGFNMTRKHVKVEPQRWYYWADKLGLLVWQDMPSGNNRNAEGKKNFEHELDRLVATRGNHPCIIMWVVFNEGWGQFDTQQMVQHVRDLDPTRLVDNASGWTDMKCGDVMDMHKYPDPGMPKPEEHRAAVLGEFGGLGLAIDGHTWRKEHWGYRGVADRDQLTEGYTRMLSRAWKLRDKGLCAAVYTQITDVETETNGLITYDREIIKVDPDRAAAANTGKYSVEEEKVQTLLPTAEESPAQWRYTLKQPADDWFKPDFNDSSWKEGEGGFGTEGTPGASIHTKWDTADIWVRRSFTLPDRPLNNPRLLLHHDEDAEVYLNGVVATKQSGFLSEYEQVPLSDEAKSALKPGTNVIAIHCHQTTGGQYIDAGLIEAQAGK